jgi:hypothetical protein
MQEYERTPIDLFGEAMLRGMGWKKGEPIGGKNKAYVSIDALDSKNEQCYVHLLRILEQRHS